MAVVCRFGGHLSPPRGASSATSRGHLRHLGGAAGSEAGGGRGDAFVGGGEGDPDMAATGGAVEGAGGDQDAAVGEPANEVPAVCVFRVAGGPEIERCLGVVDPEAGAFDGRPQEGTTRGVPLVLLGHVYVVVERGHHRQLLGPGELESEVL